VCSKAGCWSCGWGTRRSRFRGWRNTRDGDRLVQQALRRTLYTKVKIRDNNVFEKAFGYGREY
jgi:type I restriction enzyme R subunit